MRDKWNPSGIGEENHGEPWHALPFDKIFTKLGSSPKGLGEPEARRRREKLGPNRLAAKKGRNPLLLFLSQFHQPLVYILLIAGAITAALQEWVDSSVIFGVVLVNAVVGFIQEANALQAIASLSRSLSVSATVLRDGIKHSLAAAELVPGDVVMLQSGDKVPADLRLFRVRELQIDESTLTGESVPSEKHSRPVGVDTLLADRGNLAYSSTLVTYGTGAGVVVATGERTEIGRINRMIATAETLETPLTRKLARFSLQLLWAIVGLAAVTFLVGWLRGESALEMFMASVALAVGAIPEGLPAALTITLAIGVSRMAKRNAIIRKLPAVETLGSTTVICSDKTGTLTQNQMTVRKLYAGGERFELTGRGYAPEGEFRRNGEPVRAKAHAVLLECLKAGLLCNDARLVAERGSWRVEGDPTEGALLVSAHKAGLRHAAVMEDHPRLDTIPFESQHQFMATLHHDRVVDARHVYLKGSVESILERCETAFDERMKAVPLDREAVQRVVDEFAAEGMRILAFARGDRPAGDDTVKPPEVRDGLIFLGLQGMIDPPRPEAAAAVAACRTAGIRVRMITGDHPGTAVAIARQLELNGAAEIRATDGHVLAGLGDAELSELAERTEVFARVAPEQKLRLVRALQSRGQIVAMTGDGVNDAPALKQADIGVAMGIVGTEVAKEAAAMVLTDDHFATIRAAVEEGRGVFDNLVKFIAWTLPTNFGEGLVITAAVFAGVALPITPVQILWINMTTAVLLGLTLAFEPKEPDLMQRAPRASGQPILTRELGGRIVLVGLMLLAGAFGLFEWALSRGEGIAAARTAAVNVFVFGELFYLFNCRSLRYSMFRVGVFSNPWVWGGVLLMSLLQGLFTYSPAMNRWFGSAAIDLDEWVAILGVGLAVYAVIEFEKWLARRSSLRAARGTMVPLAARDFAGEPPWHARSAEECFGCLNSSPAGLTEAEAERRRIHYGFNETVAEARSNSAMALFLAQFGNVLIVLLLVAGGISAYLGHTTESIVIGVIVLFAAVLGFVQEYRAERAMEALRRMTAPTVSVLRDGGFAERPARCLVPGDVVRLQAGNRVPTDLRLTGAVNLELDEAPLTGESVPVVKTIETLADPRLAVGDRRNMAYAGTVVTRGRGCGVAVATGMKTEFGRIVELLRGTVGQETPLQANLNKVGRVLAAAAVLIIFVIVFLGLARGEPFHEMLLFGIALAVAVVPEALPAVVTISLGLGAHRMARRNALIRRLPAVETLGCTSVICADKTGTLTRDEMTVRKLWVAGELLSVTGAGYEPIGRLVREGREVSLTPPLSALLRAVTLVNDAVLVRVGRGRWEVRGDPTEGALLVAAAKVGFDKAELEARFPRLGEIAFTPESKCMATFHADPEGGGVAYVKGALEVVLDACRHWLTAEGPAELGKASRMLIRTEAERMAEQALRVLAVAQKTGAGTESMPRELCFLGLAGMIDPPRPESRAAIATCEQAGIKVVMITGDHPLTARAVARELGILKTGRVLTGTELDTLDDTAFKRMAPIVEVYARVSPEHKLRVVRALQRQGQVVAMTGDGVNDAPALKQADIGVAMSITGTDVSREASAMLLADDNFASIVAAVEEGRGIFSNIRKYLMYLLSSNIGEIGLIAGATLAGLPLPLSAVQILYINLATDGLPALALAVDPPDEALMRQRPRDPRRGVFTPPVVLLMLVGGFWSTGVNLGLFVWALQTGHSLVEAMTLSFVTLVVIQFFKAYNFRSDRLLTFRCIFANRWLNLAVLWEMALLAGILYVPWLREVFGVVPLTLERCLLVAGTAASVVPALELTKWAMRRWS